MSIFEQNKVFYSSPVRLSPDQKKDPSRVLRDFFTDFHLHETKEHLAHLLETVLTKETDHYVEARDRNAIMVFTEKLEELIEAAWLLHSKGAK